MEIAIGVRARRNDGGMEYLGLDQVRERVAVCRAELEALLAVKALAGKPKARQWRFLRDAAECLWSGISRPAFEHYAKITSQSAAPRPPVIQM